MWGESILRSLKCTARYLSASIQSSFSSRNWLRKHFFLPSNIVVLLRVVSHAPLSTEREREPQMRQSSRPTWDFKHQRKRRKCFLSGGKEFMGPGGFSSHCAGLVETPSLRKRAAHMKSSRDGDGRESHQSQAPNALVPEARSSSTNKVPLC